MGIKPLALKPSSVCVIRSHIIGSHLDGVIFCCTTVACPASLGAAFFHAIKVVGDLFKNNYADSAETNSSVTCNEFLYISHYALAYSLQCRKVTGEGKPVQQYSH